MKLDRITTLAVLGIVCAGAFGCATTAPGKGPSGAAPVTVCPAGLARLAEGQVAPDFVGHGQDGMVALSALRSRTVVLHFYPAGARPSVAEEANKLREAWPEDERRGVVVIGVSRDVLAGAAPADPQAPFTLVTDTDGAVSRAYGWSSPQDDAARRTFVIGPDGTIEKVFCIQGS